MYTENTHERAAMDSKTSGLQSQGHNINFAAWRYDLMVRWLVMAGKEPAFRQTTAKLAQLQPGESVLDVGCGTGTLAIVAKTWVGPTGYVSGIDPSEQLLAGARRKAARHALSIDFQLGGMEKLPFPDQSFDAVITTFVMHGLPGDLQRQGLAEFARVLKSNGRLLIVDFRPADDHPRQSVPLDAEEIALQDLPILMKEAGLSRVEIGEVLFKIKMLIGPKAGQQNIGFVRGRF